MERTEELEHMSHESLMYIRKNHPAWKLIAARNAPLIISFLYKQFIYNNLRQIAETTLINELEFWLERNDQEEVRKSARDYLREWSSDDYSWLRRFHERETDEVQYDLTSTAQKAIQWIAEFQEKSFIGTESRLIMIFDILNQLVTQTESDPTLRIAELERKKAEIDLEIDQIKSGNVSTLDSTQIKERFMQANTMSREILSDFRAVEQNFRELNRNTREKIAKWDKGKGELIGDYFTSQSDIYSSDQGKSFSTFFEFLMSKTAQTELDDILDKLYKLDDIKEELSRSGIDNVAFEWLEGSQHVWKTIEAMSEQLRRYVDESYLEEERRINQVIKQIEVNSLALHASVPKEFKMEIDETTPKLSLPFDRSLYNPPRKIELIDQKIIIGQAESTEDLLYAQVFVDKQQLISNIEHLLQEKPKITLSQIITRYPLSQGLTEYLAYLSLTNVGLKIDIDPIKVDKFEWIDQEGNLTIANGNRVTYYKEENNGKKRTAV